MTSTSGPLETETVRRTIEDLPYKSRRTRVTVQELPHKRVAVQELAHKSVTVQELPHKSYRTRVTVDHSW